MVYKMMEVTASCLSSIDNRDKLLKAAGAAAKIIAVTSRNDSWMQFASAASDARGLIRLASWLSNIQSMMNLLEKNSCEVRDAIFMCRVLTEGIFKLTDNVSYIGIKSRFDGDLCRQFSRVSRQFLFWSYLCAVILNVYDLIYGRYLKKNMKPWVTLFQNSCDLLTALSASGYAGFELSVLAGSALGLISASIGSYDCFRIAAQEQKKGV